MKASISYQLQFYDKFQLSMRGSQHPNISIRWILSQVRPHLLQVGMLTPGGTKKVEIELKLESEDKSRKLSPWSNFTADVVNWRSLVKNQQEDWDKTSQCTIPPSIIHLKQSFYWQSFSKTFSKTGGRIEFNPVQ